MCGVTPQNAFISRYSATNSGSPTFPVYTARIIRLRAVCSGLTNSTTSTRYPAIRRASARKASVTMSAVRSRRMPCRRTGRSTPSARKSLFKAWWQHGTHSTSFAPLRTDCARASSVAVSQACRAKTMSAGASRVRIVPHAKASPAAPSFPARAALLRITSAFTSTPRMRAGTPSDSFRKWCAASVRWLDPHPQSRMSSGRPRPFSPESPRTWTRCFRNSLIWVNFARIVGRTRPSRVTTPIASSSGLARPSGSGTSLVRLWVRVSHLLRKWVGGASFTCGASETPFRPMLTLPFFEVRTSISSVVVVTWIPANARASTSASGAVASAWFFVTVCRPSKYANCKCRAPRSSTGRTVYAHPRRRGRVAARAGERGANEIGAEDGVGDEAEGVGGHGDVIRPEALAARLRVR